MPRPYLSLLAFFLPLVCLCGAARAKDAAPSAVFGYATLPSGVIKAYGLEKSGDLTPLLNGEIRNGDRTAKIVAQPSGKFLYAAPQYVEDKDGVYFESEKSEPQRKTTPITVYAIGADGGLTPRQRLTVPGVFAQLLMHPSGKFLYGIGPGTSYRGDVGPGARFVGEKGEIPVPDGIAVFCIGKDGRLTAAGRTEALYTFSLEYGRGAGERDAWWETFSPDGKYLFSFCGDGFVDHSENYLQRFRVQPNGKLTPAGEIHEDRGGWGQRLSLPAGSVVFAPRTRWAIVQDFDLYLCQTDYRGGLRPHPRRNIPAYPKSPYRNASWVQAVDPKGRFFYTGADTAVKVCYRLSEKSGAVPVCAFGVPGDFLRAEPGGRFLYEWTRQFRGIQTPAGSEQVSVEATKLTIYAVDNAGHVTVHRPRRSFLEFFDDFVFVPQTR